MFIVIYKDHLGEQRAYVEEQAITDAGVMVALYERTGGTIPARVFMEVVEMVDLRTAIKLYNEVGYGEIIEIFESCKLLYGAPRESSQRPIAE